MLFLSGRGLASAVVQVSAAHNALVESFAIHARNLIDFLWLDSSNEDDVVGEDFFDDPTKWFNVRPAMPELLRKAKRRAHKQVAHLTYTRILIPDEDKHWSYVEIANTLQELLQLFVKHAPPESVRALTEGPRREG